MAVVDIDTLHERLPDLFEHRKPPTDWEEDWLFIPIDDPELPLTANVEQPDYENLRLPADAALAPPDFSMPDFGGDYPFPGAPQRRRPGGPPPPPDALAFYLPFHYFHPIWWGIYLDLEGVHNLARGLHDHSGGTLEYTEALSVSRLFLYFHEYFHHSVEAFGTRLEITHRVPVYKDGFERKFQSVVGTDDCLEEGLANAYAYRRVRDVAFPKGSSKLKPVLDALHWYISVSPPGYRRALEFLRDSAFDSGRNEFAEDNHVFAFSKIPRNSPALWKSFPHAFSGISRITSRVNYIVRRGSSLAGRLGLQIRYLRYRDLAKRLEEGGCRKIRDGKGSHEWWEAPHRQRFAVPRHPGDLRKGTLAKIVKQAGFAMSVSEFVASATAA